MSKTKEPMAELLADALRAEKADLLVRYRRSSEPRRPRVRKLIEACDSLLQRLEQRAA
jgi:hypothetical protein